MSDMMRQIEAGIAMDTRAGSRGESSRMRSLLEWERVFLAEQQWAQKEMGNNALASEQPQVYVRFPASGEIPFQPAVPFTSVLASSGTMVPGTPALGPTKSPASLAMTRGPVPSVFLQEQGAASMGQRTMVKNRPGVAVAETARPPMPSRNPTLEKPGMMVAVSDDTVKLWLRQEQFDPSSGLGMIVKLKDFLARSGLKLASVTVNGMERWHSEYADRRSQPPRRGSITQIDKTV